jgi:hypothetical protein
VTAADCTTVVRPVVSDVCKPLLRVCGVVAAVSGALTASRISTVVMSAAPANLGGTTCGTTSQQHIRQQNSQERPNLAS